MAYLTTQQGEALRDLNWAAMQAAEAFSGEDAEAGLLTLAQRARDYLTSDATEAI
ncbi:MAG: hypothetical protein QOI10_2180 [Solirubrobacterales bacterium]|jgi:hypothetical protein|nr:hypothetical protein [Solirubrobacterales bacterium]